MFKINDNNNKLIYYEDSTGYFEKIKYDKNGKYISYEDNFLIDRINNNNYV